MGLPPQQSRVASFDVVNLFFKLDAQRQDVLEDVSFTLNVDNVFDRDPPEFRQSNLTFAFSGYANGMTLGRLIQFGVQEMF